MKEVKGRVCSIALQMLCCVTLFFGPTPVFADSVEGFLDNVFIPEPLEPQFSEDRNKIMKAQPVKVLIADPAPPTEAVYIPPPEWISRIPDNAPRASLPISFARDGEQDLWGANCEEFPHAAKVAFHTAAKVWEKILHTKTPIVIRACWANLGANSGTLGYAGGATLHRNFSRAPVKNTWYVSSLANAHYGRDLASSEHDIHITINSELPGVYHWNFSTDGNVESDEYDLMTVALHEICHGLGFAGSMTGSSWGIDGDPMVYDLFTKDTHGTRLIDFDESSHYTLADALTIGRVYFHGKNAMAANKGERVELFTPDVWMQGSSYSHLSMNYNSTSDGLMVYMLRRAKAVHSPGPVTLGLLRDLGWPSSVDSPPDTPEPPAEEKEHLPYMNLLLNRSL